MSGPADTVFHAADFAIFALVLTVSMGIGLYHALTGGKQRTTKEYLTADRELRTVPVALSMLVTFVSAILVLGTPAEMYTYGTALTFRVIGYCFAVFLSSLLFVPLFFNLRVTSAYEYLERRFNSKLIKLIGSFSQIFGNVFYMGLVIYTPSVALEAVTGFPLWGSIAACGAVSTVYTTMGGMRGVIWTDVFQSCIMIGGMMLIAIQGTMKVGSPSKVWNLSMEGGRLKIPSWNADITERSSMWSLVIGGMISMMALTGTGQANVQRYCSLPTLSQAKWSLFLNIPGLLLVNVLATFTGLAVYAYYADIGCDPLAEGYITSSNQLVPYFIRDVLNYPGFPGVFLAVLFSGALSTLSSCLNSLSAVTWQDVLQTFFVNLPENKKTHITKLLVVFYGAMAVLISMAAEKLGMHVLQASLSFAGATAGPVFGMFLLGMLCPSANAIGAGVGCVLSLSFSLWISIGSFVTYSQRATTLPTSTANCQAFNYTLPPYSANGNATHWSPTLSVNGMTSDLNLTSLEIQDVLPTSSGQLSAGESGGVFILYEISFLWYCAIGAAFTMIVGYIISVIVNKCRGGTEYVDPKLLIPLADSLCCCLPDFMRQKARLRAHDMKVSKEDSDTALEKMNVHPSPSEGEVDAATENGTEEVEQMISNNAQIT